MSNKYLVTFRATVTGSLRLEAEMTVTSGTIGRLSSGALQDGKELFPNVAIKMTI